MFLNIHQARETVPNSKDMSIDKAELVAIFLECVIYGKAIPYPHQPPLAHVFILFPGVEALTFVATVYLLHGAKRTRTLMFKFSSVVLMFMMNTIHIGAVFRRILNAFVGTPNDPLPDAAAYLADLAGFLYRFMNIISVIQFIFLDVLVVYRCYMIWEKKIAVVIVPSVGVLAFLVTGIGAIHAFATDTTDTVFTGETRSWVSAMLCITLFTKLVCFATVLTATILPRPVSSWQSVYLRINRHPNAYKAVLVGIECGGLAVLGAIILIPMYLSGRNAQEIMLAAMSPLTGVSFLLIVIAGLLGLTPSISGPSPRRRFGGIPNARFSIPPISVSPVTSPSSRFSTGSVFNSKSPSSYSSASPSTLADSEYNGKSFPKSTAKMAEPTLAYTDPRYSRGVVRREPPPFSTAFAHHEQSLDAGSRETLPFGDGDSLHISVSSRHEVNTIPERSASTEIGSGDGIVVSQKEYVS
ncbi:hypothetical protein JB92DRAFT_2828717 [Gautieria morchelliformis]|nr:hypothetical protein JB92DRAFT_2828717 [Gautieria morchelliformis]